MKARYEDEGYRLAIEDLELAAKIAPENTEIRAECESVKTAINKSRAEESKVYRRLISAGKEVSSSEKHHDETVKIPELAAIDEYDCVK